MVRPSRLRFQIEPFAQGGFARVTNSAERSLRSCFSVVDHSRTAGPGLVATWPSPSVEGSLGLH